LFFMEARYIIIMVVGFCKPRFMVRLLYLFTRVVFGVLAVYSLALENVVISG
jgi:hypothetical protein